jgi:2-succinyl-6-hydroxy-2,4-cyclohexadiene-1-carboxylate synthase
MTAGSDAGSTRVRVGAIEIAYEEHGAGGRPFVLVHGFTGSRDDWREVLPRLAAQGRTLAPDQRGHGDSTNTGDAATYTLPQLADDLLAFLDAAGVARCDLLGHSMGGMVAQLAALARPERVASLILMDTSAEPIARATRGFFEAGGRIARESGMQALFDLARRAAQSGPGPSKPVLRTIERLGADAYWERIRRKMLAMDPIAFATLGVALSGEGGTVDRLAEIACPTTVLVGAEDEPFRRPAEVLAAGIPGARLVVIEDAHHSPQLENPEAWLDAVTAHLGRARGAA